MERHQATTGVSSDSNAANYMFKQFQELNQAGVELVSSLDSVEKTLYAQFYGRREKTSDKKVKKPIVKKTDISTVISEVLTHRDPLDKFKTFNMSDVRRIAKYLSEFQQIQHLRRHVARGKVIEVSKVKGISWNNQQITENFSKKLRENISPLENRSLWTGLGSTVSETFEKLKTKPNTGFGISQRSVPIDSNTPGPGNYGTCENFHIPSTGWKKPSSTISSFEWSKGERSQAKEGLPPNIYDVKDGKSMFEVVNKRASARGPYDVFTGPRDSSTIKNHFFQASLPPNKSWPMVFPGAVDALQSNAVKHKGRWGKDTRELQKFVKYSTTPAPNSYQAIELQQFKKNRYGFNCSTRWIWSSPQKYLPVPPPGRYNIIERSHSYTPNRSVAPAHSVEKSSKTNMKSPSERNISD